MNVKDLAYYIVLISSLEIKDLDWTLNIIIVLRFTLFYFSERIFLSIDRILIYISSVVIKFLFSVLDY